MRPLSATDPSKLVSVAMPRDRLRALDRLAKRFDVPRSEVIRFGIEAVLRAGSIERARLAVQLREVERRTLEAEAERYAGRNARRARRLRERRAAQASGAEA